MQYTIGKNNGNEVVGLHVHLGPKDAIDQYLSVKPEKWDEWSTLIKNAMNTAADSEDLIHPDVKTVRTEVQIETNNGIQNMSLDDIKPLICK